MDYTTPSNTSTRSTRSRGSLSDSAGTLPDPPKHLWTSTSSTCLKFNLNPSFDEHRKVMCDGCIGFVNNSFEGIITNDIKEMTRPARYPCTQPWLGDYATHVESGKRTRLKNFHKLFETGLHQEDEELGPNKKRRVETTTESTDINMNLYDTFKSPEDDTSTKRTNRTMAVITQRDCVTEEAVNSITDAISNRGTKLTQNEKRLAAVLMGKLMEEEERMSASTVPVVQLPGIKNIVKSSQVARVPKTYNKSTDKQLSRQTLAKDEEVASDWINVLPGRTQEKMSSIMLENAPHITQQCIAKHWNKNYRVEAEPTAAICSYAGITKEQTERFTRALFYETGLRVLSRADKVREVKKDYIKSNFTTINFKTISFHVKTYKV